MSLTAAKCHNCHFKINLVLLEMLSGHTHNTHTPTHNATIRPVILEGFLFCFGSAFLGGRESLVAQANHKLTM